MGKLEGPAVRWERALAHLLSQEGRVLGGRCRGKGALVGDRGGGTRSRVGGVSRLSLIDQLHDFGSGTCLELAFLINTRFL